MPRILAIDQSTSATKALLYDTNGTLIDKASLDHRQIYPQPGWVEHDAEEIWANTLAVLKTIVDRMPNAEWRMSNEDPNSAIGIRQSAFQCLSITNQRETIVVFDCAGKPLHHALVWQDRRGDPICAELTKAGHGEMVTQKTGLKIDTYFSASKLTWLIRNRPDIAAKLASGDALIGTIDAYLMYRLTGGKVFATDHTNASRTLLLDITSLKWDEQLCRLFSVPNKALPEVRDSTARFGETNLEGLLKAPIPICGVMGDSQASLFAHRCFAPGMAKVTIGTGSSILLNIGSAEKDEGRRMKDENAAGSSSFILHPSSLDCGAVSTIAWTHAGKATYSFEGIINYAAATIAWLKDQLGLIKDANETESAAAAVEDNGGVYLVPAFAGLSAPYWSPGARAAIVGMTAHTNRNHVIRAALESIAYQLRDVLDMMKQRAGVDLRTINADGGATRNRFLMQFIADMTGLEVTAAQIPDCSPLGAALAGMLGMGVHKSMDELAKLPREVVTYRPAMAADRVEAFHSGWKRAMKQVLAGTE